MPFKPFTGFLTQGMRNTNQNINNMNNPYSFTNSLTGTNSQNMYGFGGQGGAGGMMQQGPSDEPVFEGIDFPGGGGGVIPKPTDITFPELSFPFTPPSGIGIKQETHPEQETSTFKDWPGWHEPDEELPRGWEWQYVNGNWEAVDLTPLGPPAIEESLIQEEHFLGGGYGGGGNYLTEELPDLGYKYHETPGQDTGMVEDQAPPPEPAPPGYEWQFINGQWELYPLALATPSTQVGGGGIKGKLAKELYFPSTTGGFASAGSGITGGQGMLAELLKGMRG